MHPWAEEGFARAAGVYERGRPGYPAATVSYLVQRLGLSPERTVVDLGAGTGKLTRLLVPSGARVVAVEPVRAMRELIPAGAIEVLAGSAEAIPLPDASADAVTVAQAFHWFRAEDARAEIDRVLRPGGALAIVTNVRDETDPLQRAFLEILRRHRAHASLEQPPEGGRRFSNVHEVDGETLLAQAASESSIALLDGPAREAALAEFAALLPSGRAQLRYVTVVEISVRH